MNACALLLLALLAPCLPALADELPVPDTLGIGDTLVVLQGDLLDAPLFLAGGHLDLVGAFDKQTQFPLGHASRFPGVEIMGPTPEHSPFGTVRFLHCALLPPDDSLQTRFYELPLGFSRLHFMLEDCWLYGEGLGMTFNSSHRGSLTATDTWFSASDTSVVSSANISHGTFTDCRFAWGHTGLAVYNAEMDFRRCEFVSLDTAIRVAGSGEVHLRDCLFQSCNTMLSVSDQVVVTVDSSSFYEVGGFCLRAVGPSNSLDLVVSHSYFDSLSAPADRLLSGLPSGVIQDPAPLPLQEPSRPLSVAIHVDDSEPLDGAGGPEEPDSLRLDLSVTLTVRDTDQRPLRPRSLRVYALPLGPETTPAEVQQFQRLQYVSAPPLLRRFDLDTLQPTPLPTTGSQSLSLDSLVVPAQSLLILGVADDEFFQQDAPPAEAPR